MCVSFNCLKNALISLNVLYTIVGAALIHVSVSGKLGLPHSQWYLPIATGIEMYGFLLIALAILGLVGAIKHHQVILFFYMIILFVFFMSQLVVSYMSVTASDEQLRKVSLQSWVSMDARTKLQYMTDFHCCAFDDTVSPQLTNQDPFCFNIPCCEDEPDGECICPKCSQKLVPAVSNLFKLSGRLGILFSFTQIFGVWLTKRYRNQKDPRAHPSAFL